MTYPIIGYDNLLEVGTVTATDEAAGYAKENAWDWLACDWWKPNSTGTKYLTVDIGDGLTAKCDYIALAAHTLGSAGTRLKLQYSSNGTSWSDAHTTISPSSDVPLMKYFTQRDYRYYRAEFVPIQNLLTYSEQFDNAAWTKTRSSVSANATTSPGGSAGADKVVEDTTASSSHHVSMNYSGFTAGKAYTCSIYAKAAERSAIYAAVGSGAFGTETGVRFDISGGTVISYAGQVSASGVDSVGGGWYRCWFTASASVTATTYFRAYMMSGTAISYTGDGSSGLYLWGAQLEECDSLGEYQQTVASAVVGTCGLVGVLSFGEALQMPRHMVPGGFRPLHLGREYDTLTSTSTTGVFIGRSVRHVGASGMLKWDLISPSWVRTYWEPFLEHATAKPWFFQWDPDTYPDEVALCWTTSKDQDGPSYSNPLYMSIDLRVRAMTQ